MTSRNDPCWCGSGKKWKKCHYPQPSPQEASLELDQSQLYLKKYGILLKTPEQIEGIRAASHLASRILDALCARALEGATTEELDVYANQLHKEAGAIPASLHYGSPPFPKSICTSFNEVICHGIPTNRRMQEGDILNIDVTSILNGYYGDCSRMVTMGALSEERHRVVETSYECLMKAIAVVKPGTPISAIGFEIEKHALSKNCSVVYQFVAHGVGIQFHEDPQILHCYNRVPIRMVPGMTFTIEPMINAGVAEAVVDKKDKWTASTADGKASAQWEHTLLVTPTGCECLTNWKR